MANAFDSKHPHGLAVYCSDGRFTDFVEDHLRDLGHARIDTLTLPGGPGLLDVASGTESAISTIRSALSFLVKGHAIQHVVLVAHEGCGYYRDRFAYDSLESLVRRQKADLRMAARWLALTHPNVRVDCRYARPEGQSVVFDTVSSS